MDVPARKQAPSVRLRRLASELRELRKAAGISREEVEASTGINTVSLYRIETAKVRPQQRTLTTLLDRYGVIEPGQRERLVHLTRTANQTGWLQAYEPDLPEPLSALISFETDAKSVRTYESLFVPGLLQTETYARAVINGVLPNETEEVIEKRVDVRMQRKRVLSRKEPLSLWAVVDQAVIEREVGSPEIMADQMRAIIEATKSPNIVFQVIQFQSGAHPGMPGSFVLMSFPDSADQDLVYLDSMGGDWFLERRSDIDRFSEIFDQLRAIALSPADTTRLLHARSG